MTWVEEDPACFRFGIEAEFALQRGDGWLEEPSTLGAGVADAFPFLGAAQADRILWGMDWADKFPQVCVGDRPTLLAINCGSGVRACIGRWARGRGRGRPRVERRLMAVSF